MLTAAHVLGGLEASPPAEGSPVDHYGDAHTPVAGSGGAVGTVGQRIPGARTGPTTVAEIDAGLVRLTAGVAARNLIMGRRVTGVRRFMFDDDLEAEIPVAFVGAASRERRGLLFTARSEFRVKVANVGDARAVNSAVRYTHACEVVADDGADLARDGDSGSVLIDEEGRLVAILVAADDWLEGEPAGAVAVPAWLTFDRLGIDLPDEEVVTAEYRSAFGELR